MQLRSLPVAAHLREFCNPARAKKETNNAQPSLVLHDHSIPGILNINFQQSKLNIAIRLHSLSDSETVAKLKSNQINQI